MGLGDMLTIYFEASDCVIAATSIFLFLLFSSDDDHVFAALQSQDEFPEEVQFMEDMKKL